MMMVTAAENPVGQRTFSDHQSQSSLQQKEQKHSRLANMITANTNFTTISNSASSDSKFFAYCESQNFNEIQRKLVFNGDMELLLRGVAEEWKSLGSSQREVIKVAILQLFSGLYWKSQRNQDGSIPPVYFLWLASTGLFLFEDLKIAELGIRLASECENVSFDTFYFLFLLQKSCEDFKNSLNSTSAKRGTGVGDMATFRRLTNSAKALHEQSLIKLKRFFRSFSQSNILSKITARETSHKFSSSDASSIHESKKLLRDALQTLEATEKAYDTLIERYPVVHSVQALVTMFKRQFFREMESAKHDSAPFLSIMNSESRVSQEDTLILANNVNNNNNVNNVNNISQNTNEDGPNINKGSQRPSSDTMSDKSPPSLLGDSAISSLTGSGLSSESPKQTKIALLTEQIKKRFRLVRFWSFITLCTVLLISSCLLLVSLLEIQNVQNWLDMFSIIGRVFVVIPQSCISVGRPLFGSRLTAAQFTNRLRPVFETAKDYDNDPSTPNSKLVDMIESVSSQGTMTKSFMDDVCRQILSDTPVITHCYLKYENLPSSSNTFLTFNRLLGSIEEVPRNPDSFPSSSAEDMNFSSMDSNHSGEESHDRDWYDLLATSARSGKMTLANREQMNGFAYTVKQDGLGQVNALFASYPLFFWLPAATYPSHSPPFQGVISFITNQPTANDRVVHYWWSMMPSISERLRKYVNLFQQQMTELKIDKLNKALSVPDFFKIDVYTENRQIESVRDQTFMEGASYISSLIDESYTYMGINWDSSILRYSSVVTLSNFCSTPSKIDAIEQMLTVFQQHVFGVVDHSQLIVTICAVCAVAVSLIGAALTIVSLRRSLCEFDRLDDIDPALAIFAMFPRSEIKKVSKAFSLLKINRGIFDPDDERAPFLDLTVNRKAQRAQDLLLRANQMQLKRSKDFEELDTQQFNTFGSPVKFHSHSDNINNKRTNNNSNFHSSPSTKTKTKKNISYSKNNHNHYETDSEIPFVPSPEKKRIESPSPLPRLNNNNNTNIMNNIHNQNKNKNFLSAAASASSHQSPPSHGEKERVSSEEASSEMMDHHRHHQLEDGGGSSSPFHSSSKRKQQQSQQQQAAAAAAAVQ
eukprot:GDKJ01008854.1.p1 GENE.GDKJ01008854.1~~GDKJ01008854.1.p1  ORF type:complete len:1098 (+),score=278.48 GDKJ01008854.1:1041-4334(+)